MGNRREYATSPPDTELETQIGAEESPSEAIIRVLAVAESIEPTELPPLYDHLDLEALDSLLDTSTLSGGPSDVAVEFLLEGYRLRITSGGVVTILEEGANI